VSPDGCGNRRCDSKCLAFIRERGNDNVVPLAGAVRFETALYLPYLIVRSHGKLHNALSGSKDLLNVSLHPEWRGCLGPLSVAFAYSEIRKSVGQIFLARASENKGKEIVGATGLLTR